MAPSLGALYVAFGRPYLAMALLSASTLRRRNPEVPIRVVTNVLGEPPELAAWREGTDSWIFLEQEDEENRRVKTRLHEHTPFDRTLYLDCDTKVLGDLSLAHPILDAFDVAMRLKQNPQRRPGKGDRRVLDGLEVAELPHWNSGVILFRSSVATARFFEAWSTAYDRLAVPYDQVALVEAVFRSPARVLSLDERWNATDPVWNRRDWRDRSTIFHYASNISDRIFREVLRFDRKVGAALGEPVKDPRSAAGETAAFLMAKRRAKRRRLGPVRYAALRLLWAVSSPA